LQKPGAPRHYEAELASRAVVVGSHRATVDQCSLRA
jgi:hypothetical protein